MILRNNTVTKNLTRKVELTVAYPTTQPDALEDIVLVVVPLDAVKTSSSADHRRRSSPVVSSRAASDTLQKRDCCPSPEQANSKTAGVLESTLPGLVRESTGTEKLCGSG